MDLSGELLPVLFHQPFQVIPGAAVVYMPVAPSLQQAFCLDASQSVGAAGNNDCAGIQWDCSGMQVAQWNVDRPFYMPAVKLPGGSHIQDNSVL